MATTEDYYCQSQLSEAAYAQNLSKDMFGANDTAYMSALQNEGMSKEQAKLFANKYIVIDQYTDSESGCSGTVFQEIDGNGNPD